MNEDERRVSFDDEPLIVVDEQDNVLGYQSKTEVHQGAGILHRAFSVFLFNQRGELLLQRRSGTKPLWPLYWSNSCCSHPRREEALIEAAGRRVPEELGVAADVEFLFRFQYHASFGGHGSERELCSVFLGRTAEAIDANRHEIAAWEWTSVRRFEADLQRSPDAYTPWLKLEWALIRDQHWGAVHPYARRLSRALA